MLSLLSGTLDFGVLELFTCGLLELWNFGTLYFGNLLCLELLILGTLVFGNFGWLSCVPELA